MKGKLLGLFSILFLSMGLAFGQAEAGKGAVAGVVTDPTKAVIPGAKVILSNPGIGYHAETTANSEGYFSFKSLTVGEGYRLEVSAPGFSTNVVSLVRYLGRYGYHGKPLPDRRRSGNHRRSSGRQH